MTDPAITGLASTVPDTTGPRRTPLTQVHERLGATLTDFAGWLMPLRYGSETAEHQAVRTAAGLFDLSHMGELTVRGPQAAAALDYALVGNLAALRPGRARYTMICADDGGVLDDLIVYRLADTEFLVVANAANAVAVAALLRKRAAGMNAAVTDRTSDYALIAIQGPRSADILGRSPTPASATSSTTPATRRPSRGRPCCWPGPATPARTGSRSSPGRRTPRASGRRSARRALIMAWSPQASPPGTRSASRPGCRCMAASSAPA